MTAMAGLGDFSAADRALTSYSDLFFPGAHIAVWYKTFWHHGIVVDFRCGSPRIVNFTRDFGACVEDIHGFAEGHTEFKVIEHPASPFTHGEIVKRAMDRVGERGYNLVTHNCEHFCNEICEGDGVSRSGQVQKAVGIGLSFVLIMARAVVSRNWKGAVVAGGTVLGGGAYFFKGKSGVDVGASAFCGRA